MNIVALCGSLRAGSYNRQLLSMAVKYAQGQGHTVEEIDLKRLVLPIYDKDVEDAGLPEPVKQLKAAVERADVIFIATPEYNYSIPGGLKNALDWASRGGNSFGGKVGLICGVSDGVYGTIRMQPHLRQVLGALNVLLLPQPQVFVAKGQEAFNADGSLKDAKLEERLKKLIDATLDLAEKVSSKK